MTASIVFDKKSYILCYGFSDVEVSKMESAFKSQGLLIAVGLDLADLQIKLDQMKHCVGIFLRPRGDSEAKKLKNFIDYCRKNWIELRIFSDDSSIEGHLRVASSMQGHDYLPTYLREVFPEKFRELALFSVKQVMANMLPDFSMNWVENASAEFTEKKSYDFLVFCETNAVGFSGGITIKSGYPVLREHSKTLASQDDEGITRYFAEVGNQVLGLINYNLKKLNIEARIGLPVMIGKDGMSHYRRRSAFYMPSCVFHAHDGAIQISVHFLVPFLKGANISRDFNFEVQSAAEADALEVL